MWSSITHYHRPASVNTALRLLARASPRTAALAGGTWLVAQRDPAVRDVVDLSGLRLAYIERRVRRLRLGAMTRLQSLITSPQIHELADGLLAEAARRDAPRAIRNVATLGGTLVAGDSTSEVLLALLALEAQVVIRAPDRRVVSAEAFLGNRTSYLPRSGLVIEIVVPLPSAGSVAAFAEISRTPRDRPIVNAAAVVLRQGSTCRAARLVLGGVAPSPIRLPAVETWLVGKALGDGVLPRLARDVSAAVSPPSDTRASAEYRQAMAGVVVTRALREAWTRAREE